MNDNHCHTETESIEENQSMEKQRGRPKQEVCRWKDSEYKANYFKSYFEDAKNNAKKVMCECGRQYTSVYKYKHMHSKYHLHYEEVKRKFSAQPSV